MTKTDTWQTRPLVRERPQKRQDSNFEEKKSLVKCPRFELDTKTYWLTDRQSQCDFDFDFDYNWSVLLVYWLESNLVTVKVKKFFCRNKISSKNKTKTKLHGLSPRANYTDRATAACRRCQLFADRGCHMVSVTYPYGRILGFLDRSRYFSTK
jgi:hypothetical protein